MNHTTTENSPELARKALSALADVEQKTQQPRLWGTVPLSLLTAAATFSLLVNSWWQAGGIFLALCLVTWMAYRKDCVGIRAHYPGDQFPTSGRLGWAHTILHFVMFFAVAMVDFPSNPRPLWAWAALLVLSVTAGIFAALWYRHQLLGSWINKQEKR